MKTVKIYAGVWLLAGFMAGVATAQELLSAKEVQQKSIEATRVDGLESLSTLLIINEHGEERVRKMAVVSRVYDHGTLEKKLIRFLEPADVKDTGFLSYDYNEKDDDKWIYMPALRKTRRIISSENAKSFMGSEFSYADMSLPTVEDFTYAFLPDETVGEELCYVMEVIPKNDDIQEEYGFSKKIMSISKHDFVPRKAIYYDFFGDQEKIMEVNAVIEVDQQKHKYKMQEILMTNVQDKRKSISRIDQIQFNPGIPDEYFTTRYLEK
ncbi:MAG: outer membrane lipoprotein-sorting protein [Candidatus Vecturithrix sp.]|jgi:outer membrane lipoprotein-sorting protein|nr:outer membrane lipoprotein-sorting protein [Candidatus Vecturithrix sp.]